MTTQLALFDYEVLDTETRIVVQQRTTEIKALMKRAATDIIEIGQKLTEVKGRLGHGHFGGWLRAEFDWTPRTAQQFMLVAETFKNENFSLLEVAPSALYLLAAPSTPDSARQEALDRASEGEPITHQVARDIVGNHRQPQITVYDEQPQLILPNVVVPYTEENADLIGDGIDDVWDSPMEPAQVADLTFSSFTADEEESNGNGSRPMKPKVNRAGDLYEPRGFDACQTPGYAIDPLLPHLPVTWIVWEPAQGERGLVEAFYDASRPVIGSDILDGQNFFDFEPDRWDCIVTNPPYSIKYQWLERCYQLGKPFALLLPVETLGARRAQALFIAHGVQIILLDKRINFKMPNIGWEGSSAQFPVAWFTWGLDLETQIVFAQCFPE
jgi:hypothetical protein